MAIKFGMSVADMILQLTKGFMKATGRKPEALEKIKIQQEAVQRFKDMNKVVDMEGNILDTSKPIMGGTQEGIMSQRGMFDNIFNKMQRQMGKGKPKVVKTKNREDVYGLEDYDTTNMSEIKKQIIRTETKLGNLNPDSPGFREKAKILIDEIEALKSKMRDEKAEGGRIGLKDGMDRRGFLKLMGGLAALPVLGKFFKVGKVASKAAPGITTPPLPNKPEWFDSLVNKVITMGEDVTKKFAFKERQTVHKLDIDEFEDVKVYQDADAGEIRVSYESPNNAGEQSVDLVYKKELPDEANPNPSPEFYAVEPEPRVVNRDGDMEFDGENLVDSVDELMSDTTKLKEIATGKKKTLGEFVKSKKKKDEVKSLNENPIEQAEYIESKYGPGPEPDFDDIENFASGGIARMLGE